MAAHWLCRMRRCVAYMHAHPLFAHTLLYCSCSLICPCPMSYPPATVACAGSSSAVIALHTALSSPLWISVAAPRAGRSCTRSAPIHRRQQQQRGRWALREKRESDRRRRRAKARGKMGMTAQRKNQTRRRTKQRKMTPRR